MLPHFTLTPELRKITFLTISLFTSFIVFCQPDYDFRNPVLLSGTDRQINAVYLFQNVKPGVDATVTVKDNRRHYTKRYRWRIWLCRSPATSTGSSRICIGLR